MNAKMDGNQAEIRLTVCAIRSELKETIQHEMKAVIQPIRSELDETTACNEATETGPDPGMMQAIEEHQEIAKEDAAVMPVGGPRKRGTVCNLAAERRQKKERTGEIVDVGGGRLPLAGRCPAVQKWHGKKETGHENWDPGKLWTVKGVLPCRNKDDPQCESDTGERTRTPETSQRQ
jgi:hypothetical protein